MNFDQFEYSGAAYHRKERLDHLYTRLVFPSIKPQQSCPVPSPSTSNTSCSGVSFQRRPAAAAHQFDNHNAGQGDTPNISSKVITLDFRLRVLISSTVFLLQRLPSLQSTRHPLTLPSRLTSASSKTWERKETLERCSRDSPEKIGRGKFSSQSSPRKAFTS